MRVRHNYCGSWTTELVDCFAFFLTDLSNEPFQMAKTAFGIFETTGIFVVLSPTPIALLELVVQLVAHSFRPGLFTGRLLRGGAPWSGWAELMHLGRMGMALCLEVPHFFFRGFNTQEQFLSLVKCEAALS